MATDSKEYFNGTSERKRHSTNYKDAVKGLGKLPPQALDLEEAVLGALMIEKDALTTVVDILKPENFYDEKHRKIFEAIHTLFNKSAPVDILTVTSQLRAQGDLDLVGGAYKVNMLTTNVNSSANIEAHARIIVEHSIKRELIKIASKIETDAFEDTTDVFELLDQAEKSLFDVAEMNIRKSYASISNIMQDAMAELEIRRNHTSGLTGIPSGFTKLDNVTSGWQKSDLVILAARPGMGKTAFVVSAMRNAAVDFNHGVAIFSLEMSAVQLANRLMSAESELGSEKLKKGNLEEHEWQQLISKTSKLTAAPIFIDDTAALSILELRAKCRRLKAQHNIQLIIIDYLQLMVGDTSKKGAMGNREQEIASISRALKNIAKELSVPVIALSQLSRAVESRGGDKRPQLSDLRESGSIEQDADMVLFLYRPEYYQITEDADGMPTKDMGEVIIAKHRNGSLDSVKLKFIGKFTKFEDLDDMGYDGPFPSSGLPNEFTDNMTLPSKANQPRPSDTSDDGFDVPF